MIYIFIVNSIINMLVYNYVFNKFLLVVGYLKSKDIVICELPVLLRHRKIEIGSKDGVKVERKIERK